MRYGKERRKLAGRKTKRTIIDGGNGVWGEFGWLASWVGYMAMWLASWVVQPAGCIIHTYHLTGPGTENCVFEVLVFALMGGKVAVARDLGGVVG